MMKTRISQGEFQIRQVLRQSFSVLGKNILKLSVFGIVIMVMISWLFNFESLAEKLAKFLLPLFSLSDEDKITYKLEKVLEVTVIGALLKVLIIRWVFDILHDKHKTSLFDLFFNIVNLRFIVNALRISVFVLIVFLISVLPFLLMYGMLFLMGLEQRIDLMLIIGVFLLPLSWYIGARLSVVAPVAVLENADFFSSFSRSKELTAGHTWKVLAVFILGYPVVIFFLIILLIVFEVLLRDDINLIANALNAAFIISFAVFEAVLPTICYYDLKNAGKNTDSLVVNS